MTTHEAIKIVREEIDAARKPLLERIPDLEHMLAQVAASEAKFHAAYETADARADELAEQNRVLRLNNDNPVRRMNQLEEEIAHLRADLEATR
jgi:hypothetical protein